jgi:hypothetical protein
MENVTQFEFCLFVSLSLTITWYMPRNPKSGPRREALLLYRYEMIWLRAAMEIGIDLLETQKLHASL